MELEVRGERDALERRGLFDRQIVVVDEVAELRLVIRTRVAGVDRDVQLGRDPEPDVGADGEAAEVALVQGELRVTSSKTSLPAVAAE